mmetsp:Transcript_49653/g.159863  ORF Transcript_49653/g.159863 Transcript_49653/m.159863 type:complete len:204 (-) Transcript_49653:352-963(-)
MAGVRLRVRARRRCGRVSSCTAGRRQSANRRRPVLNPRPREWRQPAARHKGVPLARETVASRSHAWRQGCVCARGSRLRRAHRPGEARRVRSAGRARAREAARRRPVRPQGLAFGRGDSAPRAQRRRRGLARRAGHFGLCVAERRGGRLQPAARTEPPVAHRQGVAVGGDHRLGRRRFCSLLWRRHPWRRHVSVRPVGEVVRL